MISDLNKNPSNQGSKRFIDMIKLCISSFLAANKNFELLHYTIVIM
jgi:hypothetical protein